MGYLALRTYFDNLAAPAPRVRDRQQRSDLPPGSHLLPRRGVPLRATPRSFSRWLLDASHGGGQRDSFRGLLDAPSAVTRQAPDVRYPLSHVRVLTRDEFAAVHGDGGKDGSFGLTVAPLAAPNNGARGNP